MFGGLNERAPEPRRAGRHCRRGLPASRAGKIRCILNKIKEVHYIVLRASKEETMKRAIKRSKLDRETNIELVETMWEQFSNLGIYESNVIDTTTHSVKDTVSAVKEKIVRGTALLL